ncbi:MAG TPA: HNH endonuclease [Candidatus Acidoferrum sp.]
MLRLVERSCQAHHVVCVRLPQEVQAARAARTAAQGSAQPSGANSFGEIDFLQIQPRRHAIHAREGGHCFYFLRRLITQRRCLDHVVPRASLGSNSYRNLVSCCLDCNSLKADRDAVEFVRSLYRDRRLSAHELTGRLRALDDLAAGKLIPPLPSSARTEMKVRSDPSGPQGEKPVG